MELIGTVVRLQVQRSRLKPGAPGERGYDPAPLQEVAALEVTPRGVTGDGVLDVHHADHPDTRNVRLRNGLSVMTRPRYDALRARFGMHLTDGIAGESLLLDDGQDVLGDVLLETDEGVLELTAEPAPPCVEFARFCLRASGTGPDVLAALAELQDGARGFYLATSGTGRVTAGARVFRA
ncbi:MAG: hypothetical protein LC789_05040 [Actinobacteria bacterium]|nr:hypothetical protein [Actinomycetota bacterium]MCA1721716.1 hypothetical protein [Actinomycetota bacterium]